MKMKMFQILSAKDQKTLFEQAKLGQELFKQKKYSEALDAFKICHKINPNTNFCKKYLFDIYKIYAEKVEADISPDLPYEVYCDNLDVVIGHYEDMVIYEPSLAETQKQLAKYRHKLYLKKVATIVDDIPPEPAFEIENLIFQGGGIKGLAYKGAYEALVKQFINIKKLKRVGGTSAGALTALPIALGYKTTELEELVDIDFTKFFDGDESEEFLDFVNEQDAIKRQVENVVSNAKRATHTSSPFVSSSGSVNASIELKKLRLCDMAKLYQQADKQMGLFKGDYFRERWAERLIQQKTEQPYLTFKELHELHIKNPETFKDIYVVGVNLNKKKAVVLSYETTPNAIISDALRITMSIPGVFKPHQLYMKNADGKRVLYNTPNELGISPKDKYVDGGVLMNYPLSLFDFKRYLPNHNNNEDGNACIENPFTLGLRLVEPTYNDRAESPGNLTELLQRIAEINVKLTENDNDLNQACKRSIYINHMGISAVKFNLVKNEKEQLYHNGKKAVEEQLPKLPYDNPINIYLK